jgi:hypothetical protein
MIIVFYTQPTIDLIMRMAYNVCNKNAVAKRTLIEELFMSEAMVHFTFLLLLCAVAPSFY